MKSNHTVYTLLLLISLIITAPVLSAQLDIEHARIPAAPPASKIMAAYMLLSNKTGQAITVEQFSSPAFERCEIHKTVLDANGVAKMQPVQKLIIKSGDQLSLKPGSYHLMLFNPKQTLKTGSNVILRAHLNSGKILEIKVKVVAMGHDSHKHNH